MKTADLADDSLWDVYKARPHKLLEHHLESRWPPKLLAVWEWFWEKATKQEPIRAIIKGPRGGGKSRLVAGLEFSVWYWRDWDCVNLGGSLKQSEKVYGDLQALFGVPRIAESLDYSLKGETKKKPSEGQAWISVLAASTKQTRAPHAGGPRRGGFLVLDEVCEADDETMESAYPIVNTAHPSAIIQTSTFHKAFGLFQTTWDDAEAMGWTRFEWDCFDIAETCRDDCRNVDGAPCVVWDYCQGRAHDAVGWMPIAEIRQARKEHDDAWFRVEMLGARPPKGGLVYDPDLIAEALVEVIPSSPIKVTYFGIDWGLDGQTVVLWLVERGDGNIYNELTQMFTLVSDTEIKAYVAAKSKTWGRDGAADASHGFQNKSLKEEHGLRLREVEFGGEKEDGIANVRHLLELRRLKIPKSNKVGIQQMKNYKRHPVTGRPIKKDDHYPDALLCAALRWQNVNAAKPVGVYKVSRGSPASLVRAGDRSPY